jgi:hypothetical protein
MKITAQKIVNPARFKPHTSWVETLEIYSFTNLLGIIRHYYSFDDL